MAYDFFTQPRGPDIDVSLYGDASIQGAQLGKMTPNKFTSVVQGLTEGVETGLNLGAKWQQNQIRAHEIERQPVEDAIQDEQLKRQRQIFEMEQLELDTAKKLEDITVKTKKAELEANNKVATEKLKDLNNIDSISTDISSPDPNIRAKVLSDPGYQSTLLKDEKLAENVLSRLLVDPELSPEQKQQAMGLWNYSKRMAYNQKLQTTNNKFIQSAATQLDKDSGDVLASGGLSPVIQGMNVEEITGLQAYPKGFKKTDANGRIIGDNPIDPTISTPPDEFEVFTPDGKSTGQVIKGSDYQKLYKLKGSFSAYNKLIGGSSSASSNTLDRSGAGTQTQSRIDLSTRVDPNSMEGASPVPNTNQNIVIQRQSEFNKIAKNPPPGIATGSIETRLQEKKKAIRDQFSGFKGGGNGNSYGGNMGNSTPKTNPTPLPPTSEEALSNFKGSSVKLKSPDFALNQVAWRNVNTDPILQNEPALIKGLAAQESGQYGRNAVSPTGVKGLLQVTKATAAMYGLNRDIPEQNVLAGKKFLYDQMVRFDNNLRLALTAYNAGPAYVSEAVRETGTTDWEPVKEYLKGILSPKKYQEVENYADKVIAHSVKFMTKGSSEDDKFLYLLQTNNLVS